jgi:hypothetical protein
MTTKATDLVYSCSVAMFNYLKNSDLQALLKVLIELQEYYQELHGKGKAIWFKFGSDDTLCTTISDIEVALCLPKNHGNHKLMLEQFAMVCNTMDANSELRVYFS